MRIGDSRAGDFVEMQCYRGVAVAGAEAAAIALVKILPAEVIDEVTVVGPAPCPIERIKSRWRWHILLKSDQPGELTRVSRYFMERFEVPSTAQLRVTLDRDPVALL